MLNKIMSGKKHTRLLFVFLLFEIGVGKPPGKMCMNKQYSFNGPSVSCYGYNEIPTKEEGAIAPELDLSNRNNVLETLPTEGFRSAGLTNLKILLLGNCQIREIETGAFSGLENLTSLGLDRNKIEVLNPTVFEELIDLVFLSLSENPLRAFQSEFPRLLRLNTLDIKDCNISSIEPDLFKNLENLEQLDISGNLLVKQDLEAIASVKHLNTLYLDNNRITNFNPIVFKDLVAIQHLSLSENPLKKFPTDAEFPKLLNLGSLDFRMCNLSLIQPNFFKNLPNLKHLYLDKNELKTLESAWFKNLRNLVELSLAECELESLPKNMFQDLENLRGLSLSDNHLTTFDWKQLVSMKNLKYIWLHNQLNCSCSTMSLLNFFHNKSIKIEDELVSLCQSTNLVGKNQTLLMKTFFPGSSDGSISDVLFCPPGNTSLRAYYAIESADLPGRRIVNATLQCEFNGFPPADVSWKKDGKDLDITGKVIKFPTTPILEFDIESDYDFRQKLFIEQFDAGDVGKYECLVSNPAGTSIQTTFLDPKILGIDVKKPKIASLSATENNDTEYLTLKCVYSGVPRPSVEWVAPNLIHFFNEGGHVVLKQNEIWYQTRVIRKGLYRGFNVTCHVKNYLGEDKASITIEGINESDTKLVWILALAALVVVTVISAVIFFIRSQKKPGKLLPHEISGFFTGSISRDSPDYARLPYDKEKYEIVPSKFQIHEGHLLGSGAFGIVCKGTINNKFDNGNEVAMEVAVKMTKNGCDPNEIKGLLSELKLLPYLGNNHPNVVKLMGAYTEELMSGKLYCFLELCSLGSLHGYLRKLCTNYSEMLLRFSFEKPIKLIQKANLIKQDLLQWSKEIATGLEFIASKNIVHADIATRNVLLTSNKTAKISDFGLSRRLYQHQSYVSKTQVPRPWKWMSPEALRHLEFTEKSDVWSFGVTLWEIWSLGDDPFPGLSFDVNFPTNLEKGFSPGSPRIQRDGICSVMNRCWTVCPESRPTFTEVKDLLQRIVADVDEGPSCSGYETLTGNSELKYGNVGFGQQDLTSSAVMNPVYT